MSRPGPTSQARIAHPAQQPKRTKQPLDLIQACAGLLATDLSVAPEDVVFVKGIVEASEGLAVLFASEGGDITLAAPKDRADEFEELLEHLAVEVNATVRGRGGSHDDARVSQ